MALTDVANYTINKQRREKQEREEKQREKEKKRKRLQQYKKDLKYYTMDALSQHFEIYGTKIYSLLCENNQKDINKRRIVESLEQYKDIKNVEQINVDIELIYFETLNKLLTRYKRIEKERQALEEEQEEEEEKQTKNNKATSFFKILWEIIKSVSKLVAGVVVVFMAIITALAGSSRKKIR